MQMRRQAREVALQILFQNEFSARISAHDFLGLFEESVPKEAIAYADSLVHGVSDKRTEIDNLIQTASAHWSLARMSIVDRNILRLSVFEIRFATEGLKPSIAINEAVELAKRYGSTDSPSFVNGVLDSIAKGS